MSSNLLKKLAIPKLPPKLNSGNKTNKLSHMKQKDFSPSSWKDYFDKSWDLKIGENSFKIYESGQNQPVLLFLHGGGFSALTWALLIKDLRIAVDCRCIAFDCRSHGCTKTSDDLDLNAATLVKDVEEIVNGIFKDIDTQPPIILIGHSMGGAIATRVVYENRLSTIIGLIVIDVVEGTALEALAYMQSFLKSRPSHFSSLEKAIEYCHKSGQIKNLESAKVSVVGQLKRLDNDDAMTCNNEKVFQVEKSQVESIQEEEFDNDFANDIKNNDEDAFINDNASTRKTINQQEKSQIKYEWRIDLTKTEPFWRGWFEGLSKMFLSASSAKLLLLAGVDRMDKELMVGQMQGKFQMTLLQNCGHTVHEDNPDKVSEVIATFLKRNKFVT